jgi:hypothetical protein
MENFLAIAYFRITEFRSKILDCLYLPDVNVKEWRATEFDINSN